jgi:hypothetical protein
LTSALIIHALNDIILTDFEKSAGPAIVIDTPSATQTRSIIGMEERRLSGTASARSRIRRRSQPGRLLGMIPVDFYNALNLVTAGLASEYLSLVPEVPEIVIGIRASR